MLDDIALFIQIVKHNSLTTAAAHLNLPTATISRRLQRLENTLGEKLLNRSARQCTLTQAGEVYFQNYVELVEQFELTQRQLNEQQAKLSGKLKVLAPLNLSHGFLRPMWLDFTKQYPEIQLELLMSNERADIINSQADLAIRVGPQISSQLQQKKLGSADTLLVTTAEYLKSAPQLVAPHDLKNHRIIGTTLRSKWTLTHFETSAKVEHMCRFNTIYNDTSFVKYQVCDGQGIALLPRFELIDELKSGRLIHVLPKWRGENRDIFAIWPSGRLLSKKATCLKESLINYFTQHL